MGILVSQLLARIREGRHASKGAQAVGGYDCGGQRGRGVPGQHIQAALQQAPQSIHPA